MSLKLRSTRPHIWVSAIPRNCSGSARAGTTGTLFENVADYRPTTANTINIQNGARFIVNNVSSRSSNATIVQHGGLAKTANINTF